MLFSNLKVIREINASDVDVAIVVVAFNNEFLISRLLLCMHKYCNDNFALIIVDNSNESKASLKIKEEVEETGDFYIRAPKGFKKISGSKSHARALNYVYNNIIVKLDKVSFFATMDHDLFPFKSFSIKSYLNNKCFYGLRQERNDKWYLWPGFSMYDVKNTYGKIDFNPCKDLDTGGMNWYSLFSTLEKDDYQSATEEHVNIRDQLIEMSKGALIDDSAQSCIVSIIDDTFIHMIDGSNWSHNAYNDLKRDWVMNFLDMK